MKKIEWTPRMDSMVRDCYTTDGRPPLHKTAKRIGVSIRLVYLRAIQMDLIQPKKKPASWSSEEIEILQRYAHVTALVAAKHLRKAGYQRSADAVEIYRKRYLGSREDLRLDKNVLSGNQLAKILCVNAATVSAWVRNGWLKAKAYEGCGRENGVYLIKSQDIREFIINYTGHINFAKVDKYWLVDILCPHGAKSGGQQ